MKKRLVFLLAGAVLLVACNTSGQSKPDATQEPAISATSKPDSPLSLEATITSTPEPVFSYDTEIVSIITEDDLILAGTFFDTEGEIAVLFVHMAGSNENQKDWIPFATSVAQKGFPALTFDLRCYGESDCRGGTEAGWITLNRDMQAAMEFLRSKGFKSIVCAGASMGGRACITVAFDEELAGLIIISGTASDDPEKRDLNNMINPGMPKLFIVSESDPNVDRTADMTRLYESAPEPKAFHTFPGAAHGTEFFTSPYGGEISRLIYSFLYGIRDTTEAPTP